MFALGRATEYVHATGIRRTMPAGPIHSLEGDAATFLHDLAEDTGPAVLVGALPFDVNGLNALYQPESFERAKGRGPFAASLPTTCGCWSPLHVAAEPAPAEYAAMVRQALAMIARGDLEKVVLARSLRVEASVPVDPLAVAARLAADPHATTFLATLPCGDGPLTLVGATPELLVSRSGSRVVSHPLAGSAARSRDSAQDEQMARTLLHSDKDQREHALVVEAILDQLAPHCVNLATPQGTTLMSTATMWHLGTRIEGVLKEGAPSAAGLAALLHPTPAIAGSPRREALAAISTLESHDRGFYAGTIGWMDAQGDGEWHVTLRCAEIRGPCLTLHAGAGIVAGSDPDAEIAETGAKFRAMLRALEMDERVAMLETVL